MLTGIAAAILVAACNLSGSNFGVPIPWAAQACLLFVLFLVAARLPFGPSKAT